MASQAQFQKSEYATFVHSEPPLYSQDFMVILKGLLFQVAGEGSWRETGGTRGEHCPWGLDQPPVLFWISFSLSLFSWLNFHLLCLPLALATLQSLTCMLQCSRWLSSTQYEGPKARLITTSDSSGVYCCSRRPFPLGSCIFSWGTSVTWGTEGRKAIKKRQ